MKTKLIILAVVAIMLGGAGYYSQKIFNNSETSDWQTYRNEEFGYQIKAPKNWEIRDISTRMAIVNETAVQVFSPQRLDIPVPENA